MTAIATVLVLGCGYLGEVVAGLARDEGKRVITTVRGEEHAARLRSKGFEVVHQPSLTAANVAPLVGAAVHVVVAFPPDGSTDAAIATAATGAAAVTYVSSTGVYGDGVRDVNDETPVTTTPSERVTRLLAAEASWRTVGATVLRSPAIYGSDRGIHQRIIRGEHRLAGDGSTYTSRIHVVDLARLVLASAAVRGETFVVGDLEPATQRDIAAWVSQHYGVPMPPSVPRESVPETLRSDRKIDGSRALRLLGVELRYPSFRTGMAMGA